MAIRKNTDKQVKSMRSIAEFGLSILVSCVIGVLVMNSVINALAILIIIYGVLCYHDSRLSKLVEKEEETLEKEKEKKVKNELDNFKKELKEELKSEIKEELRKFLNEIKNNHK